ncbi:OmpA/MotB family protein [Larsenimonas rhizosphaerae]|uniref:OmpA/MotB family protein n=1 Tax=Larsenimonas rhizosphaerae TaxID=2944682 RepID=UPI002033A757|nr:flagellar motor protein MotB [Larsenimonas rhizosphaerae]MCM2131193.1 flagellar motor protein MotB [Larsenimonas rhizosphaerae]
MYAKRAEVPESLSIRTPARRRDELAEDFDDSSLDQAGWLISYLDVLTLLIMLFVILLMFNRPVPDIEPEPVSMAAATGGIMPLHRGIQPMVNGEIVGPPRSVTPVQDPAMSTGTLAEAATPLPPAPDLTLTPEALMAVGRVTGPMPMVASAAPATDNNDGMRVMDQLKDVLPVLDGVVVQPTPQGITFRIQDRLLFSSGDVSISPEGERLLTQLVPALERFKGSISVEGHTDSQPISTERFPSNWELSTARASAVLRLLRNRNIAGDRLRAVGMASTRPLADNDTPDGRAENRRVELVLKALP